VIGAGRVGAALGAALGRAGHEIVAASGVSEQSVARAERLLPGVPLLPADEVVAESGFVLLAVPDDVLRPLVSGLADTDAWQPGQLVAHTSGAQGIGVLDPAAARGVLALALHPVMTFTGRPEDVERLFGATFGVTAAEDDEAAWHVGEALTVEMGAEPVRIPDSARALYHAALTHGANHLMTLVADCAEVLREAGIGHSERLVAPLLSAALDNVLRHGDRDLTGPVARGDLGTVRKHLAVLADRAPEVEPAYRALARRTVARSSAAGLLDTAAAKDLTELLDDPAEGQQDQ